MNREPSLTYRGALAILGHHDRPRIARLDKLLGGVILAAGAAALGGTALAPLAAFAAVWGWVDQKNEAISLLRSALDSATDRLLKTSGYERHQLICAAHTTIVAAAFFETLQELVGKQLRLTEADKEHLVTGEAPDRHENLIELLYNSEVPTPSPARGFEENHGEVLAWLTMLTGRLLHLLRSRDGGREWNELLALVPISAAERYRSHYLSLCATVPEFLVWASLGEHAATRTEVTGVREDVRAALDTHSAALSRLERVLESMAGDRRAEPDLCAVMSRANRGVLREHIVAENAVRASPELAFPTLEEAFIDPRYRVGGGGGDERLASENWWRDQPVSGDLDLLFAAHLTSPRATRAPMLLLGHPGAGKSSLTKMLAARLPASAFTTVRVPLRRVNAVAPVHDQIQEALDLATHRRVNWWELAEQSRSTIRVVLLDGLDELLQAAGHRGGYLQEVVTFQRQEADQGRPVMVIVTSRTVVADQITVPQGTVAVKLEEFGEDQIAAWLRVWNSANSQAIASGAVRALTPEVAMRQAELARQPLLLLMLALYSADPGAPALDEGLSTADLYRRLLDTFARREIERTNERLTDHRREDLVRDQLWRLTVAAFAMFNRGRQNITDTELGADLLALDEEPSSSSRIDELGRRLIGQFFFVHAAEARMPGEGDTRQSFEFLHATFGEYLMAAQAVELLAELALESTARRGSRDLNDNLAFALLSHEPLTNRRTILTFLQELTRELPREQRRRIIRALSTLIENHRCRFGSERYADYRPTPTDRVRQLAAYSANLFTLLIVLEDEVWLDDLWLGNAPLVQWRSMVTLWMSGLDTAGRQSILSTLSFRRSRVSISPDPNVHLAKDAPDVMYARLVGDDDLERRLRFGHSSTRGMLYSSPGDSWADVIQSSVIALLNMPSDWQGSLLLVDPDDDVDDEELAEVLNRLAMLLKQCSRMLTTDSAADVVEWMARIGRGRRPDPYAMAAVLFAHPELTAKIPWLTEPETYAGAPGVSLLFRLAGDNSPALARLSVLIDPSGAGGDNDIRRLLAAYRLDATLDIDDMGQTRSVIIHRD
ncbi:NACHT domain-containing protein [Nonomuraea sp. NPDC049400]|uniref:NACHT domain-containing protein n=1 Tax=Nonomuraea sp. NPDC049400 TaxID=3364352 RepID=UPI00379DE5B0